MADLSNCSIQELYNELHSREHVAVCVFVEDDVILMLEDKHIEPTKEAIDYVFGWKIGDRMCERGWEVIDVAADEYRYEHKED